MICTLLANNHLCRSPHPSTLLDKQKGEAQPFTFSSASADADLAQEDWQLGMDDESGPAPQQALSKRNAETALMPPPPQPKRIKRPTKVLDEDVYTDALSHIIARDFFPGLLETEAQQEYLEALDSKNNDWIRDAGRRLHQAMTPGPAGRGRRGTSMAQTASSTERGQTTRSTYATPRGWAGDTPARPPSATSTATTSRDDGPRQPQVDASLSLGAFQSKYTSEDNESFNALLDRQNIKRSEKYAFLYHANNLPIDRQIEYRSQQQKLLQAKTDSHNSSTALVPLRPSQDLDDRPVTIDSFTSRQGARNSFMFGPDSIEDTHTTVAQAAAEMSLAAPKSVSYAATRLPASADPNNNSISAPLSPTISAIDAAIAGRPQGSSTDAGYSGAETPRVNGYAFVDAEPTPSEMGMPVSDEEADRQERVAAMALMPKVQQGDDHNPFKLQAASRREELHHRIVDKQNTQRRKPGADRLGLLRGQGPGTSNTTPARTPTPSFSSGPAAGAWKTGANLTPAARMLAASIGKTPTREPSLFGNVAGRGGAKSRAWTPTPRVKRA